MDPPNSFFSGGLADHCSNSACRWPSPEALGVAFGLLLVRMNLGGMSRTCRDRAYRDTSCFARSSGSRPASWDCRESLQCCSAVLQGSTIFQGSAQSHTIVSRLVAWTFDTFVQSICARCILHVLVVTFICVCLSKTSPPCNDVPSGQVYVLSSRILVVLLAMRRLLFRSAFPYHRHVGHYPPLPLSRHFSSHFHHCSRQHQPVSLPLLCALRQPPGTSFCALLDFSRSNSILQGPFDPSRTRPRVRASCCPAAWHLSCLISLHFTCASQPQAASAVRYAQAIWQPSFCSLLDLWRF